MAKKDTTNSDIVSQIVKKFDNDKTMKFADLDLFAEVGNWISTGSPFMDYKLNTLGYPTGIIEICGPSRGGKTTLGLQALRSMLMKNPMGIGCILSSERRDNMPYAVRLGVPVNKVMIHKVKNIEMVYNKFKQTIEITHALWDKHKLEGKPKFCFVWDSLGGTVSAQESKKADKNAENEEDGQAAMASAARALKQVLRNVVPHVYDEDITFIVLNHVYDKIGSFGGGTKSYGGKAIEYMPSMRIETTRIKWLQDSITSKRMETDEDGEESTKKEKTKSRIGQLNQIEVIKNDFHDVYDDFQIPLLNGHGFCLGEGDIQLGIDAGLIKQLGKGGKFRLSDKLELSWASLPDFYRQQRSGGPLVKILRNKLTEYAHAEVIRTRTEMLDKALKRNG